MNLLDVGIAILFAAFSLFGILLYLLQGLGKEGFCKGLKFHKWEKWSEPAKKYHPSELYHQRRACYRCGRVEERLL